jgi:hypothetical protein
MFHLHLEGCLYLSRNLSFVCSHADAQGCSDLPRCQDWAGSKGERRRENRAERPGERGLAFKISRNLKYRSSGACEPGRVNLPQLQVVELPMRLVRGGATRVKRPPERWVWDVRCACSLCLYGSIAREKTCLCYEMSAIKSWQGRLVAIARRLSERPEAPRGGWG